jgi:hypothetical protein
MPTSFTLRPLAAALALGVLSSAALASEADWFLKSDQLKGASVVKDRKGQVDVNGFQWSVTAETSWLKGGGASVGKVRSAGTRAGTRAFRPSRPTSLPARP